MIDSDALRAEIGASTQSIAQIADRAGIPRSTLYSFVAGETKHLRADTQSRVENALSTFPNKVLREDPAPFDRELKAEADSLGLDPEAIARKAVEAAIKRKRMEAWIEENREAMEANAKDIRENGLWSDGLRTF